MGFKRISWVGAAVMAVVFGGPTDATAQTFFIDGTFSQAYTSAGPLPSPAGFAIQVGRTGLWGPLGVQMLFRSVSEDQGEISQSCGFATCVEGPFDQSYTMRTFGFGLSYDFINPTDVVLTLGMNAGANWQVEKLEHLTSGTRTEGDEIGSDYSLGGSLDLRLRPWLGPLRPVFSVRYDKIWASDCLADASCGTDRSAWGFSAGLGVAFRQR